MVVGLGKREPEDRSNSEPSNTESRQKPILSRVSLCIGLQLLSLSFLCPCVCDGFCLPLISCWEMQLEVPDNERQMREGE